MRPLFSCVMPVKGPRPYMDAALASLSNQEMGDDLEIIIQDADIEPDKGQSDALNKGFAKAKGEWLFWLNADDVLLIGALKKVKSLIHSTAATTTTNYNCFNWITGNLVYIDKDSRILKCAWERGWKWAYEGFPVRTYGPSSFFRRELFEEVGGFDTGCRFSMDTDLWCKFRSRGHWFKKIPDYLWGFRIHDGSLTSGDLMGETPVGMEEEQFMIDARYGLARHGWPLRRLQLTRMLDGSYMKSYFDTLRLRGRLYEDVVHGPHF